MSLESKRKSYDLGCWGEKYVVFWRSLQGFKLLKHRFRTPFGEIDCVFWRRNTLYFTEVKTTPEGFAKGLERFSYKQRHRLQRSALWTQTLFTPNGLWRRYGSWENTNLVLECVVVWPERFFGKPYWRFRSVSYEAVEKPLYF